MCKKSNIKEFIEKSIKIHGNKYDYSEVNYKTALIKVNIICYIHGVFSKTPNKHISRKQGCPKCGIKKAAKKRTGVSSIYKGEK